MLIHIPKFNVGDIVKFKESVFTSDYASYFMDYKGHEFRVKGYAPDDDDRPLYDHIILHCETGNVQVNGAPHDSDLVLVKRGTILSSAIKTTGNVVDSVGDIIESIAGDLGDILGGFDL